MKKNDFPLLQKDDIVYLDTAATSQKPQVVIDEITRFYETYNANAHRGVYHISQQASDKLQEARQIVAKFIGAQEEQIVFTKNTTEALNLLARTIKFEPTDNVVTTVIEHHANLVPWQELAPNLRYVEYNNENHELGSIAEQVDEQTKVVSFTGMSNVSGQIFKVKEIIKEIREKNPNTIIILDACQYAVHQRIDVQDLDVDFLAFSAHKVYGPLGVGFLYGKTYENLSPFLYGGSMIEQVKLKGTEFAKAPTMFEAGTPDAGNIIAAARALAYMEDIGHDKIIEHEQELKHYAVENIKDLGLTIIGHHNDSYASVISFYHKTIPALDLAQVCADKNVCVRVGHHCCQPFMEALGVSATMRASIGVYTEKEDIDKLVAALKEGIRLFSRG